MMFGWRTSQSEADRIVGVAMDAGINFFDTSVSYGRGASELMLAQALATYRRENVIIATKCGLPSEDNPGAIGGGGGGGGSSHNIIRQCDISLKRLNTDYIDILQLHRWFHDVPIEESFEALDKLIRIGKIKSYGTSNFQSWQVVEGLRKAELNGLIKPVSEQLRYNILDRSAERELLPVLERHGVRSIIYSPLAEGLLTGRYNSFSPFEMDSRFAQSRDRERYAKLFVPAVDRALSLLASEALRVNRSIATLATAWLLSRPKVSTVLAGVSRAEQLCDIGASRYVELNPDFLFDIDRLCPPGTAATPQNIIAKI